ncbi:MAG: hypothetical protein LUH14_10465 [Clostridiaceae bacterium]|nr:hypothetical protein [Clostridiaceae bacterium]
MEDPITRAEHEEFKQRLEEQNKRQDKRIELLEENLKEVSRQTTAIEKLANSMDGMKKEQEKQGERLETLEGRDGDMWRTVVKYAITVLVGAAIGFLLTQIGV